MDSPEIEGAAGECYDLVVSIHENIELYHGIDLENYIRILTGEFGAEQHPAQIGAFVIDHCPFYAPAERGDHISILSFNKAPLPYSVIQALVEHPEIAPDSVFIRWTQEQDLIWEGTLGALRAMVSGNKKSGDSNSRG